MDQLQKEGRLIYQDLPRDWDKYRFSYVVHQTRGVEESDIYAGNNHIKNKIYSFPFYQYRLLNSAYRIKNPANVYAIYKLNQALKKSWKNSHYYESSAPLHNLDSDLSNEK